MKMPEKFDFNEDIVSAKEIITIYGAKGDGKSSLALSPKFPGKIASLSFDNKTGLIKKYVYNDDPRIKVFNAIKYFDEDPNNVLDSAELTVQYIQQLIEALPQDQVDWILFDGLEIMTRIAEFAMRRRENLKPFQGVSNMNVWKIRKLIIRAIHNKAVAKANKGVIYTTYSQKDEIIEQGEIVRKKDIPAYLDVILYETDTVIHVDTKREGEGIKFFYEVISSKVPRFKTGFVGELVISNEK